MFTENARRRRRAERPLRVAARGELHEGWQDLRSQRGGSGVPVRRVRAARLALSPPRRSHRRAARALLLRLAAIALLQEHCLLSQRYSFGARVLVRILLLYS